MSLLVSNYQSPMWNRSGNMKVVLLTTDTTHHTYFAWKLNEVFPLQSIFLEMKGIIPRFETLHPFESLRDVYEHEVLLRDFNSTISDVTDTRIFESMNDEECVFALQALEPDVVIVFGTGKLYMPMISVSSVACLNLHGGNPERYRGLDTHLWAIYHDDFRDLVTTIHHVDADLDTGDIVLQSELRFEPNTQLHQMRTINTKVCINLSLVSLSTFQSIGCLPSRRQVRYYSFMPAVLKEDCVRKFDRYVRNL